MGTRPQLCGVVWCERCEWCESQVTRKKRKVLRNRNADQAAVVSFEQLLVDERQNLLPKGTPCYTSAAAGPPLHPPRHYCSVCGYMSKYTCMVCGSKYCSPSCLATHKDTRCLKFTV
eukprot:c5445_g1_i3.p2 GENE.c5445_g1_i3~~c5445_g1_i3.p2  ORF type:complete len:117 (-),score=13.92 c5445_g1_i3:32-382(-)